MSVSERRLLDWAEVVQVPPTDRLVSVIVTVPNVSVTLMLFSGLIIEAKDPVAGTAIANPPEYGLIKKEIPVVPESARADVAMGKIKMREVISSNINIFILLVIFTVHQVSSKSKRDHEAGRFAQFSKVLNDRFPYLYCECKPTFLIKSIEFRQLKDIRRQSEQ